MHIFRSWRWNALALLFGFSAPTARAELITPDSIPNPPSAVASAQGTPVSPSNLVNLQYKGVGLVFPGGSAITQLNGVSVWAPVSPPTEISGQSSGRPIDYAWNIAGRLVSPGSLNPTTVSSLAVEIVGNGTFPLPFLSMHVYGSNGQILPITPLIGNIANTQDWTFTGPGIRSFSVSAVPPSPSGAQANSSWGIAGISFTPAASTPEPTSLALAGLGAFGLAARLIRRRIWRVARTVEV